MALLIGSDVPARYVHLSARDIDNAYDGMHGLYEPAAAFCMRCWFALDDLLDDPDVKTALLNRIGD